MSAPRKPQPGTTNETATFRDAVKDAVPLAASNKTPPPRPSAKPIPQQRIKDERAVLADSLSDGAAWGNWESGEELVFLRDGLARQVLRKLRRGEWVIQGELDLHGMTSDEARPQLAEFLNTCKKRGLRCVRVIHGKGLRSKNREPVLKKKVAGWLAQREEILAFCQARQVDGGSGAVLVLLKPGTRTEWPRDIE